MARIIKTSIEDGKLTISMDGFAPLSLTPAILNEANQAYAILHGCKQKICDAAALPKGATEAEKYAAMREVYERITSPEGTWNKQGEGAAFPSGLLFKALCRLYDNKSPEDIRAFLDKKDKKEQAALRANPKVAAIIEEIKAESARDTGIDADSLLSELEDI